MKNLTKLLIIAGFFASAGIYIHDRQLDVHRITVRHEHLPEGFEGARVLHLSDLHSKTFGEMNGNLISSCEACKPDIIFFTGDLISKNENRSFFDAKLFLFERLTAICDVYFILGNHEQYNPENCKYICDKLKKLGVKILKNESDFVYRNGDRIKITGLRPSVKCYRTNNGYADLLPITEEYVKGLLGGLLSPERRFFPKYTKGTYFYDSSKMIVSAGLGKFRVNNPAEIVVCTLTRG